MKWSPTLNVATASEVSNSFLIFSILFLSCSSFDNLFGSIFTWMSKSSAKKLQIVISFFTNRNLSSFLSLAKQTASEKKMLVMYTCTVAKKYYMISDFYITERTIFVSRIILPRLNKAKPCPLLNNSHMIKLLNIKGSVVYPTTNNG